MACVGIWKGDLINFNCSSFSQLGHQEEKENSQPPISIKKNSVLNKKAIIIPNIHISDGGGVQALIQTNIQINLSLP